MTHHRTRVEVGYALEPYLTDSQASDLIGSYFLPHYKTLKLRPAVEATIEYLINELKKHLPELAQTPTSIGSGGSGAEVDLLKAVSGERLDEEIKTKLSKILVPQAAPEASYRLEIAMMTKGIYLRNVPLFDEQYRKYKGPDFPPSRNKEIARLMEHPYMVATEGDLAVIYYLKSKVMGPVFLKKGPSGWYVDRSSVMKLIIYDYSNEGWYILDSSSSYLELLKKHTQMRKIVLASGRPAWIQELPK